MTFRGRDTRTVSIIIIMKFLAVFALLVACVSAANLAAIAKPGFPEGRIINGHEAEKGEAPFIRNPIAQFKLRLCAHQRQANNLSQTHFPSRFPSYRLTGYKLNA
uniref:Secreted protein n=1 Tax=Glossina brevipalpis TaxID=37001 RepID=A0A1A9WKJ4_9MUSC